MEISAKCDDYIAYIAHKKRGVEMTDRITKCDGVIERGDGKFV
jgi:hypothetical protein